MVHQHKQKNDGKLSVAVLINILLTIIQIIAGAISGSLSLIADAVHNLIDAGAIVVAIISQKIGNKSANKSMTYGYKRAEIIGVLINSTSLIIIGIYLIYESAAKYLNPTPIDGWIVFWVGGAALIVDLATAALTYSAGAKSNMNIRAAFIHNISDALASLVVIVAGILIINYELYIIDLIATLMISTYVIIQGAILLKKSTLIIMQATPEAINIDHIQSTLEQIDGVNAVDHTHVWQLDDKKIFLETHLYLHADNEEEIKHSARQILHEQFGIKHCTLETHDANRARTLDEEFDSLEIE